MKKIQLTGLPVVLIVLLFSCTQSNQKLIVGRWIPTGADTKSDQRIVFFEDHTAVSLTLGKQPEARDSIQYKLTDDGKTLITTEKDGKVEELNIVNLSKTDLALMRKGHDDTFRLKRE